MMISDYRRTPEYQAAGRRLLRGIAWYGVVALGPILTLCIVGIIIMGPSTQVSRYIMLPVLIWGSFWVGMMMRYVRAHPLPSAPNSGAQKSE
jgi:hypothetical protein